MLTPGPETSNLCGHSKALRDGVIQMLLTLKPMYRLPLRAFQSFAMSLRRLELLALAVPNYSTLSRRAKALRVILLLLRNANKAVHLLADSTGLKLFDEGEWKV